MSADSDVLSTQDRLIARKITEDSSTWTEEQRVRYVAIHRNAIAANDKRRAEIVRELSAIDRANAMRRLALEHIAAEATP